MSGVTHALGQRQIRLDKWLAGAILDRIVYGMLLAWVSARTAACCRRHCKYRSLGTRVAAAPT
eukprot:3896753-Pyramimonas_sp.AAC.1